MTCAAELWPRPPAAHFTSSPRPARARHGDPWWIRQVDALQEGLVGGAVLVSIVAAFLGTGYLFATLSPVDAERYKFLLALMPCLAVGAAGALATWIVRAWRRFLGRRRAELDAPRRSPASDRPDE